MYLITSEIRAPHYSGHFNLTQYCLDLRKVPLYYNGEWKGTNLTHTLSSPSGLDDAPDSFLKTVSSYLKYRREDEDPVMHLRSLEHKQDGTMNLINQVKTSVEKYLTEHPDSARIATHGLRAYRSGVQAINVDSERQAACSSGLFMEFLRIMNVCPLSCKLQCVGIDCIFHLMGGFSIFASIPHPQSGRKTVGGVSEATKSIVIGTLESLVTEGEGEGGMKILIFALNTIINCYNLEMGPIEKK